MFTSLCVKVRVAWQSMSYEFVDANVSSRYERHQWSRLNLHLLPCIFVRARLHSWAHSITYLKAPSFFGYRINSNYFGTPGKPFPPSRCSYPLSTGHRVTKISTKAFHVYVLRFLKRHQPAIVLRGVINFSALPYLESYSYPHRVTNCKVFPRFQNAIKFWIFTTLDFL